MRPTCWAAIVGGLQRRGDHDQPPPLTVQRGAVAARVVVLPAPAAPSMTSSRWSPAIAATTCRCPASNPSQPKPAAGQALARVGARECLRGRSRPRCDRCLRRGAMNRAVRSASTSRTCWDVNALMCSGRARRPSNGTHRSRARGGEVFGQLPTAPAASADDPAGGDRAVRPRPRTSAAFQPERARPQPGQHVPSGAIAVQGPHRAPAAQPLPGSGRGPGSCSRARPAPGPRPGQARRRPWGRPCLAGR